MRTELLTVIAVVVTGVPSLWRMGGQGWASAIRKGSRSPPLPTFQLLRGERQEPDVAVTNVRRALLVMVVLQQERAGGLIPTNYVYRLPTESEWEYADRAGTTTTFYLGSGLYSGQANFEDGKGLKRTCKVGSYRPNSLGLYDMHGNVWEWCDDLFDPKNPATPPDRVYRG